MKTRSDIRAAPVVAMLFALLVSSAESIAQGASDKGPPDDSLEALDRLQKSLSADVYVSKPCNPNGYLPIVGAGGELAIVSVTGRQIIVRCKNETEHRFVYTDLRQAVIVDNGGYHGKHPCVATAQKGLCLLAAQLSDKYVALSFLENVKHLARTRGLATAADTATLANAAVGNPGETGEIERRAQVRAEVLLKDGQQVAAVRIYRDALQQRPTWAQGHYNLALVYDSLELYPEAIMAMRRYLRLAPNAPDARAAQDQTYAWEAFLPTEPLAAEMQK